MLKKNDKGFPFFQVESKYKTSERCHVPVTILNTKPLAKKMKVKEIH